MNTPRDQYKATDDPVQRYIILLNYCNGDIERFCSELKEVKEIADDTERRISQDDIRATDFVNVFQKFKLSFNLMVC